MTEAEAATALALFKRMVWQPDETRRFRRRLFAEEASMQPDEIKLLREYLLAQQNLTELYILGKKHTYTHPWRVLDVWYQTAPGSKWAGTESAKVRLYLSLRQRLGANDKDGPWITENGCKYLVQHEFYWDVETLPELPTSSSGVNYTMQGVTRDRDTGLLSCVIERRETARQTIEEYTQEETAFEKTEEALHLNVKSSEADAVGEQAGAANGVIVTREITKNDDCTQNIRNRKRTEKLVTEAIKERQGDLRGVIETTVERAAGAALPGGDLVPGESRRSEKTPGDKYNNTSRTVTPKNAQISSGQAASPGETRTTSLRALASEPAAQALAPEKNKEKRRTVRRNDLKGWDVEEETIEHKSATTGELTSGSQGEVRKTKVSINSDLPSGGGGAGAKNHEKRISATPNNHGSFTVTEEDVEHKPATTGELTSGSPGEVRKTKVSINSDLPSGGGGAGAKNHEKRISATPNNHGSFTVTEEDVEHKSATTGELTSGSADRNVRTKTSINSDLPQNAGAPGANVEREVSASPNNHGSYTVTERTVTHNRRTVRATSETPTMKTVVDTTINDTEQPSGHEAAASPNEHGSQTTRVVTHTPKPMSSGWITWNSTEKLVRATYKYEHGLLIFINQDEVPPVKSGKNCQVNARINQYGKYDGSITYRQLKSWEVNSGGSGGGGSMSGQITATLYDPKTNTWKTKKINVRTYWGTGNEGSEASDRVTQKMISGLHLPPRTYAISITD